MSDSKPNKHDYIQDDSNDDKDREEGDQRDEVENIESSENIQETQQMVADESFPFASNYVVECLDECKRQQFYFSELNEAKIREEDVKTNRTDNVTDVSSNASFENNEGKKAAEENIHGRDEEGVAENWRTLARAIRDLMLLPVDQNEDERLENAEKQVRNMITKLAEVYHCDASEDIDEMKSRRRDRDEGLANKWLEIMKMVRDLTIETLEKLPDDSSFEAREGLFEEVEKWEGLLGMIIENREYTKNESSDLDGEIEVLDHDLEGSSVMVTDQHDESEGALDNSMGSGGQENVDSVCFECKGRKACTAI